MYKDVLVYLRTSSMYPYEYTRALVCLCIDVQPTVWIIGGLFAHPHPLQHPEDLQDMVAIVDHG